jgi:amidohydrolase
MKTTEFGSSDGGAAPVPLALPDAQLRQVQRLMQVHANELVAFRRRLHAEPEPSYNEVATTDAVIERLLVEDLQPVRLSIGTGLVCDVGPGEPTVALRADIDALPLQEESQLPFASRVAGVAHACGHDVHTTAVLGAGLILRQLAVDGVLQHGVRLIFEPGEEQVPGGAVDVIGDGWLTGLHRIYALHCQPLQDLGTAGYRVGPITSASDLVEVTVAGPGGHTARPDLTVNLVDVLSRLAVELPPLVGERVADAGPTRMVFGALHTGDAPNVIPNSGVLRGSLRTPSLQVWDLLPDIVEQAVGELLGPTGAQWSLRYVRGVAPVDNDAAATAVLAGAAASVLGPESLAEAEQSWGGDSFGWFTREVPGSYLRLGTHNPAWQHRAELHHPSFRVDERAIGIGAAILALSALATPPA